MTAHPITRPYNSRRIYVKSVGSFVPKMTQKAFEKYGFSSVTLLTDWAIIAGSELSQHTQPERLKWPRKVAAKTPIEDVERGRPGATLILRVDPARALEIQYGTAQLIERINAYFGYNAIDGIKVLQAPIQTNSKNNPSISYTCNTAKQSKRLPRHDAVPNESAHRRLNSLKNAGRRPSDEDLGKALDRLEATFLAKGSLGEAT